MPLAQACRSSRVTIAPVVDVVTTVVATCSMPDAAPFAVESVQPVAALLSVSSRTENLDSPATAGNANTSHVQNNAAHLPVRMPVPPSLVGIPQRGGAPAASHLPGPPEWSFHGIVGFGQQDRKSQLFP